MLRILPWSLNLSVQDTIIHWIQIWVHLETKIHIYGVIWQSWFIFEQLENDRRGCGLHRLKEKDDFGDSTLSGFVFFLLRFRRYMSCTSKRRLKIKKIGFFNTVWTQRQSAERTLPPWSQRRESQIWVQEEGSEDREDCLVGIFELRLFPHSFGFESSPAAAATKRWSAMWVSTFKGPKFWWRSIEKCLYTYFDL